MCRVGLAVVACSACSGPGPSVPDWCGTEGTGASVRYSVHSRTLALREAWRRGGLREGEDLVSPEAPSIDRAGRVALIDRAIEEVVAIRQGGEWLGPVVKQGDGPGEIGLPIAVAWGRDGRLLVADFERQRIVEWSVSGGTIGEVSSIARGVLDWVYSAGEAHWGWFGLASNGDVLLDRRERTGPDAPVLTRLEKYSASETGRSQVLMQVDAVALTPRRTLVAPGFPRALGAIGPDGVVAVTGASGHYRVRLLKSDGSDSVIVCRETPGVPLSRAEQGDTSFSGEGPARVEFDEMREWLRAARRPTEPLPIGRLFFGSTGRLWVERDRPNPFKLGPPAGSAYDIFSELGEYVGTVQAPSGVTLYGESDAWVIGYEVGSLDETSVVAYELLAPPE